MNDHDLHERFEQLMSHEPPHRALPKIVEAGDRQLRRRRLAVGGAVLAVAVAAVGGALVLPGGSGIAHDGTGFADSTSTTPSVAPTPTPAATTDPEMGQTLDPNKRASYTYGIYPGCGGAGQCDRYRFESKAARKPVVGAIEFRLTDGSSKRVETDHGAYDVVITGSLPSGDRWTKGGLVDATGQSVDLFAGLTLFAADGSVLATATATDSDELDPYLELR